MNRSLSTFLPHILLSVLIVILVVHPSIGAVTDGGIRPWVKNSSYWQYKGKPLLLLGGSRDDNLFQIPNLENHLKYLVFVGANYIRNTMSDRKDEGFEVYPFAQLPNGKYDLNQWNKTYWNRFEKMLNITQQYGIIVQIEVWDRFDYSRKNWVTNPYNPSNNINYDFEKSGFLKHYPEHAGKNRQPFFYTTPLQKNNEIILHYQQRFVDKILSYSLRYDHVLYCIDNETSAEKLWGMYWAKWIKRQALEKGKKVFITEMWDSWDIKSKQHRYTFDHPEIYGYIDVSQNNQRKGQVHWDNLQWVRRYISQSPRPINTVKTYGVDGGRFGSTHEGIDRWWRNLIGGAAAMRFQRPGNGLGLSKPAANAIRSARMLESLVKLWNVTPANQLLGDREKNEAYLAAAPSQYYVLYFTDGGSVTLDLKNVEGTFEVKWIDIGNARWGKDEIIYGGKKAVLTAPGKGHWIVTLIKK